MYAQTALVNTILSAVEMDTANYRVIIHNTQINTIVTRNIGNVQQWMIDNKLIVLRDYEDNQNSGKNVFGLELKWIPGKKIVYGPSKGQRKCDKLALMVFCTKETCLIYQMLPYIGVALPLPIVMTTADNIFFGYGIEKKVEKARESEAISQYGDDSHPLFPNAIDVRQPSHPALNYFPDMRKISLRRLGTIILKRKLKLSSNNKVTNSFRKKKPTFLSPSKGGKMIFNMPAIRHRLRKEKVGVHIPESSWDAHYLSVNQVEQLTVSAYICYKIGITMHFWDWNWQELDLYDLAEMIKFITALRAIYFICWNSCDLSQYWHGC